MRYIRFILFSTALCLATNVYAQNIDLQTKEVKTNSAVAPNDLQKSAVEDNLRNIDELKTKAESGDMEAQLDLGYIYLYGVNGTNIDYKQALSYYEMAAKQNSAVAYNNLGSLYFSGIGTDVDYPKAIHFFEEAAKLGSSDAAVNLAIIYLSDKFSSDDTKVLALLKQAEKTNNVAKYLLGYCYLKGYLVKQNYNKAFQLIKPLADDQYDEAQYILSDFYINGVGTIKNYKKAVSYLEQAADQGYPVAIMRLANILDEGKIYPKDVKKAHVLYNIASVLGEKDAAFNRDALEENLSIEDLLSVQAEAEDYKAAPSEKTKFIRQTFGESLKTYIDNHLDTEVQEEKKAVLKQE